MTSLVCSKETKILYNSNKNQLNSLKNWDEGERSNKKVDENGYRGRMESTIYNTSVFSRNLRKKIELW